MEFNERVHAYIAAKYYVHLTEHFGERGKKAFLHATQYYALQRGWRMAQRAIRDGQELTQATYNYYGEWVNTESAKEEGISNIMTPDGNGALKITRCPWYTQFHDMGLTEAGAAYCKYLDSSISRGFNPDLGYEVDQTLHTADCCIHRLSTGKDIAEGSGRGKNPAGIKNFEYHCAHSYWAYNEVTAAIFQAEGEAVNAEVLADVAAEYGQKAADTLMKYRNTNFNVCE